MLTFFRPKNSPEQRAAEGLYAALVKQSRNPVFYSEMGVPDTVDGRFDSVLVHCFILMYRLGKGGRSDCDLSQALYDIMFVELDRAVREMGVGDLSVNRHIRRMMKAFNGRVAAYESGLGDPALLMDALRRNLYGTVNDGPADDALKQMATYISASVHLVMAMDINDILAGQISWADLPKTLSQVRTAS